VWCFCRRSRYGLAAFLIPANPEKAVSKMDIRLYVGNLPRSTTQDELNTLFAQAGAVVSVEVIRDRISGEPKGFAFITMGNQSDADKAISLFNAYTLGERELKVNVARPREERPRR
jgi:RNA recognition motif-containing protein